MSHDSSGAKILYELGEHIAQETDAYKLRQLVIQINTLLDVIETQLESLHEFRSSSVN